MRAKAKGIEENQQEDPLFTVRKAPDSLSSPVARWSECVEAVEAGLRG